MSTIEEAREQARAAAEIVEHRLAGRGLGGSLIREADKDVPALRTSLHALRTLLDATEPRPITDEMVEAAARVMFDGPDGMTGDYTWAEMVGEDPIRADLWRADARAALEAAEEARR